MGKYHIHIDPPLPDPQRIKRHEDFDSLYDHYRVQTRFEFWRQLYRNPRNFGLVALIAGIVVLVFQANETETPVAPSAVRPPVASWNPAPQPFTLSGTTSHRLAIDSTVQIEIPAYAFRNTKQDSTLAEIQLTVRALSSPVDWMLAGIPMNPAAALAPDRSSMTGSLILEIQAWQGDEPLTLAPHHPILVHARLADPTLRPYLVQLAPQQGLWQKGPLLQAQAFADSQALLALGPPPSYIGALDTGQANARLVDQTIEGDDLLRWKAAYLTASQTIGYTYEGKLPQVGTYGFLQAVPLPVGLSDTAAQYYLGTTYHVGAHRQGDSLTLIKTDLTGLSVADTVVGIKTPQNSPAFLEQWINQN